MSLKFKNHWFSSSGWTDGICYSGIR